MWLQVIIEILDILKAIMSMLGLNSDPTTTAAETTAADE